MRNFVTLFFLVSLGAVGAVLYTPALPEIAKDFHISTGLAQLTITLYLIAYPFGQLPYGPLGNAIGRRKTVNPFAIKKHAYKSRVVGWY